MPASTRTSDTSESCVRSAVTDSEIWRLAFTTAETPSCFVSGLVSIVMPSLRVNRAIETDDE